MIEKTAAFAPGARRSPWLRRLARSNGQRATTWLVVAGSTSRPPLEHVVVWLQRAARDLDRQRAAMAASLDVAQAGFRRLKGPPVQLRLESTSRSRLR